MLKTKVINEKQNLTFLKWSHVRSTNGIAGTFLKSESNIDGTKMYYTVNIQDNEKGPGEPLALPMALQTPMRIIMYPSYHVFSCGNMRYSLWQFRQNTPHAACQ